MGSSSKVNRGKEGEKNNRGALTLRIQACVYAPREVQTVSGLEIHQTHTPSQRRQGESHSGCHPAPETHEEGRDSGASLFQVTYS